MSPEKRRNWSLWPVQVVCDFLVVLCSFSLGHYSYHLLGFTKDPRPVELYLGLAVPAAFVLVFLFERMGLYRAQVSVLNIQEFRGTTRGALLGGTVLIALSFYVRDRTGHELSRVIVTLSCAWILVLANAVRVVLFKLRELAYIRGVGCRRILIYGAGTTGRHLLRRLSGSPQLGFLPVGFLDDRPGRRGKIIQGQTGKAYTKIRVEGGAEEFTQLVQRLDVDEVFVAMPGAHTSRIQRIFDACEKAGVAYRFVPHLYGLPFQDLEIETLDGIPLTRRRALAPRPFYEAAKRLFDIAFAGAALLALSPVMLVVAWLVRRDSDGPALFVQDRVGRDGKVFQMYKFRTMFISTPVYEFHPKDGADPRVTRLGRWLRRLSLDELPQFLSVLRGDMSVVGPRPEMPFIVAGYTPIQRRRLEVKPGITGLWQISADRSRMIHQNMDYDLFYVYNRGLLLDIIIIIETCFTVVRGVGAF
jgi:exopolysaccharide biosynthesis polyprenyl glycosylphosphotransferase